MLFWCDFMIFQVFSSCSSCWCVLITCMMACTCRWSQLRQRHYRRSVGHRCCRWLLLCIPSTPTSSDSRSEINEGLVIAAECRRCFVRVASAVCVCYLVFLWTESSMWQVSSLQVGFVVGIESNLCPTHPMADLPVKVAGGWWTRFA